MTKKKTISEPLPGPILTQGLGYDDLTKRITLEIPINAAEGRYSRKQTERIVDIAKEFYSRPSPRGYGYREARSFNMRDFTTSLSRVMEESLQRARNKGLESRVIIYLCRRGIIAGADWDSDVKPVLSDGGIKDEINYAELGNDGKFLWFGCLLPNFQKSYSLGF